MVMCAFFLPAGGALMGFCQLADIYGLLFLGRLVTGIYCGKWFDIQLNIYTKLVFAPLVAMQLLKEDTHPKRQKAPIAFSN